MIGDRKKSIFSALLLLALFGVVFTASWFYLKPKADSSRPGAYGAIAMSADSGIYGAAWGFHDPQSATQRSLAECTRSGGANCVIKASLKGNCGSLITSGQSHQSYVVTDGDKFQAAAFGLAQCQASGAGDCTVREQICGSGG
jgi:hypothetical protein